MEHKKKRVCYFCEGESLQKGKEIVNLEDIAENEIVFSKGELHSRLYDMSESLIYETKFIIKYCPICGRKIKKEWKKTSVS